MPIYLEIKENSGEVLKRKDISHLNLEEAQVLQAQWASHFDYTFMLEHCIASIKSQTFLPEIEMPSDKNEEIKSRVGNIVKKFNGEI